jgi:hypothetical protein
MIQFGDRLVYRKMTMVFETPSYAEYPVVGVSGFKRLSLVEEHNV